MIPKGKDGNLKAMGENLPPPGNFSERQPPVSVSDESVVVHFQYSMNLSGIISQ